jgi:succinyl-diaminopimelate desuccinylase
MKTKLDYCRSAVLSRRRELSSLISKLIRFESENPPVEDYEIQLFIREELEKVGLKVKLHYPGDKAVALTSSFGGNEPGLIFYGHSDVVPAGDRKRWRYPPYSGKISNGRIFGRGASDMKAALGAELLAFRLLFESEVELPGRLEFVSVLDEENWHRTPAGNGTSGWLLSKGELIGKSCVMGEPGGTSVICIGERGDYWIKLRSTGKPRHGSAPVYDENPCVKLLKCLDEIHECIKEKVRPPKEVGNLIKPSAMFLRNAFSSSGIDDFETARDLLTHYSMNVGRVSGGTMINIVPEDCEAEVAFCIPLGGARIGLDEEVRRILKEPQYSNVSLEYIGESEVTGPSYTSQKSHLVKSLKRSASEVVGNPVPLYLTQGTSDANVFRSFGVDTCFYGPGTFEGAHGYDESVSIRDSITALKVYLTLVGDFFGIK